MKINPERDSQPNTLTNTEPENGENIVGQSFGL
jgi:hypothetical protein